MTEPVDLAQNQFVNDSVRQLKVAFDKCGQDCVELEVVFLSVLVKFFVEFETLCAEGGNDKFVGSKFRVMMEVQCENVEDGVEGGDFFVVWSVHWVKGELIGEFGVFVHDEMDEFGDEVDFLEVLSGFGEQVADSKQELKVLIHFGVIFADFTQSILDLCHQLPDSLILFERQ
jgi:hypothetical protein